MKKMMSIYLAGITFFFFGFSAIAQNKETTPPAKKPQIVDFGGETITGSLARPEEGYFNVRKRMKHERLLSLRKHWKERLVLSVGDL